MFLKFTVMLLKSGCHATLKHGRLLTSYGRMSFQLERHVAPTCTWKRCLSVALSESSHDPQYTDPTVACQSPFLSCHYCTATCTCCGRVINGVQTGDLRGLFNPEGIFLSTHGGGAGNNWGSGYHQAEACSEGILDMLGALRLCIASSILTPGYVNTVKLI